MPSQWDHRADKDLLLAIIDEGQLKSINWTGIAAKMKAKDYTFTHEACRQHFQKIRKESGGRSNGNPDSGYNTPTKGTKKPTAGSKRKSASKTAYFSNLNDQEDDEEIMESTPSKKRKAMKKEEDVHQRSAPIFKQEQSNHIDLSHSSLYDEPSDDEDTCV